MYLERSRRICGRSGRARVMVGPVDQPGRGAGLMALPACSGITPRRSPSRSPPPPPPALEVLVPRLHPLQHLADPLHVPVCLVYAWRTSITSNPFGCIGYTTRDGETYSCQLKCRDPSGDDYYITFTRKSVRVSSYQDDSILDAIEDWADAITELD